MMRIIGLNHPHDCIESSASLRSFIRMIGIHDADDLPSQVYRSSLSYFSGISLTKYSHPSEMHGMDFLLTDTQNFHNPHILQSSMSLSLSIAI